jgi:hypothetical protein
MIELNGQLVLEKYSFYRCVSPRVNEVDLVDIGGPSSISRYALLITHHASSSSAP